MNCKKLTVRFDLDRPDERQAWEYLQSMDTISKNRAVLSIINQAERTCRIQEVLRRVVQKELSVALRQLSVQPIQTVPKSDDGMDDTIMNFLESFT